MLCVVGCESSHDVSGAIDTAGSDNSLRFRYIKLVNDPKTYWCNIKSVPACGVGFVHGQEIAIVVRDNDEIEGLVFL